MNGFLPFFLCKQFYKTNRNPAHSLVLNPRVFILFESSNLPQPEPRLHSSLPFVLRPILVPSTTFRFPTVPRSYQPYLTNPHSPFIFMSYSSVPTTRLLVPTRTAQLWRHHHPRFSLHPLSLIPLEFNLATSSTQPYPSLCLLSVLTSPSLTPSLAVTTLSSQNTAYILRYAVVIFLQIWIWCAAVVTDIQPLLQRRTLLCSAPRSSESVLGKASRAWTGRSKVAHGEARRVSAGWIGR